MRLVTTCALLLTLAAGAACAQQPTASQPARATAASAFAASLPSATPVPEPQWGPAPPSFPAGAQMAVLQGNPASTSLFTVRLRFPSGYKIAPHTHPTDENVTVIRGTFLVGMGTRFESKGMLTLPAGGFVTAPANHAHYALAQGQTEVQVHAMGPFAMTYINPADDPQNQSAKH
ncbi:MAG TPA: cupin domain-containing protein [Gemmatimonadaceae bacterium]|jgi:quercetin dioxygenase-like cupin family protein|nr:cupin domain-containing protein [Gemmatimonadaceae bacterium]